MMNIKSSCLVKPNKITPTVKLQLTEFDQIKAYTHFPAFLVYLPESNNNCVSSPFQALKNSLSVVLASYYPLAGRLNWISGGRFELDCNAMGVMVVEAESEGKIKEYADFRPTTETNKLLPYVDYSKDITKVPLLLVQFTKFKCGGIIVAIGASHIVTDGKAIFGFLSSWVKLARGKKVTLEPLIDRAICYKGNYLAKPRFDHHEFEALPMLIGQKDMNEERMKETVTTVLKLSKDQVDRLNTQANEGRAKDDMSPEYTRFEAISAHIWRCASKARRLPDKQLTSLRMTIDCRNRLQPTLPLGYFGNATMPTIATSEVGDLVSSSTGLRHVCNLINQSLNKVKDEYVKSAIDLLISQQDVTPYRTGFHVVNVPGVQFLGNPNLAITSWIGFPLSGLHFGWGKPVFVGPTNLGSDGRVYIIPSCNRDGSFVIPIRLQVAHIGDFEKLFHEELPKEDTLLARL